MIEVKFPLKPRNANKVIALEIAEELGFQLDETFCYCTIENNPIGAAKLLSLAINWPATQVKSGNDELDKKKISDILNCYQYAHECNGICKRYWRIFDLVEHLHKDLSDDDFKTDFYDDFYKDCLEMKILSKNSFGKYQVNKSFLNEFFLNPALKEICSKFDEKKTLDFLAKVPDFFDADAFNARKSEENDSSLSEERKRLYQEIEREKHRRKIAELVEISEAIGEVLIPKLADEIAKRLEKIIKK